MGSLKNRNKSNVGYLISRGLIRAYKRTDALRRDCFDLLISLYGEDYVNDLSHIYPHLYSLFSHGRGSHHISHLEKLKKKLEDILHGLETA